MVAAKYLLFPSPRFSNSVDTCLFDAGTDSFTGEIRGCLVGDIRHDFKGDGLSEINLSMTERAGFLTGVVLPD
jgi:hypothetical protein